MTLFLIYNPGGLFPCSVGIVAETSKGGGVVKIDYSYEIESILRPSKALLETVHI